jgi:hypothetical protein
MKKIVLYILGGVMFASCDQPSKELVKKDTIKSKPTAVMPVKKVIKSLEDTIPQITIPEGTIQVAYKDVETTSKINILQVADYKKQDIDPKVAKSNWAGLFYDKINNFYINPTKLQFKTKHSEFDEEKKAGWHITCNVKDENIILITGATDLVNGPVKKALLSTPLNHAGQKLEFIYNGVSYTLYTTGYKKHGKIYNCKLFLLAKVKGHYFNQILYSLDPDIALNGGGDMSESLEIEFAGDLDGDKIPDFIIATSGYSYGNTYLYLSGPAGNKAILKQVAFLGISD